MDFSYWIVLLAIYLLSLWIRRRARSRKLGQAKEAAPSQDEREGKRLPDWFRELGIVDLAEEEIEIPETETLREEIEAFDELIPEAEQPPPTPEISPFELEEKMADEFRPKVTPVGSWYTDLIYEPESLKDLIVFREIIRPPRAIKRYRPRSRY